MKLKFSNFMTWAVPRGLSIRSQEKVKYCFFLMRANCQNTETKTNDEYPSFSQSKSFAFPSLLLHSLSYYWKVDEAILPSNKGKWVLIFCSNYKLYRQSTQMVHMVVTAGSFKGNIKQLIAQHCTSTTGRCATRLDDPPTVTRFALPSVTTPWNWELSKVSHILWRPILLLPFWT